MKDQIKLFWLQREPRERTILGVGGALLGLMLLYALIWQPIVDERARLTRLVPRLQGDLVTLKQVVAGIQGSPAGNKGNEALQPAVSNALRGVGIADAQVVGSQTQASVGLDKADFAALTQALGKLHAEQGIQVLSAHVEASPEPGLVKAQLELARR